MQVCTYDSHDVDDDFVTSKHDASRSYLRRSDSTVACASSVVVSPNLSMRACLRVFSHMCVVYVDLFVCLFVCLPLCLSVGR